MALVRTILVYSQLYCSSVISQPALQRKTNSQHAQLTSSRGTLPATQAYTSSLLFFPPPLLSSPLLTVSYPIPKVLPTPSHSSPIFPRLTQHSPITLLTLTALAESQQARRQDSSARCPSRIRTRAQGDFVACLLRGVLHCTTLSVASCCRFSLAQDIRNSGGSQNSIRILSTTLALLRLFSPGLDGLGFISRSPAAPAGSLFPP